MMRTSSFWLFRRSALLVAGFAVLVSGEVLAGGGRHRCPLAPVHSHLARAVRPVDERASEFFGKMLRGEASTAEIKAFAKEYERTGNVAVKLSDDFLEEIRVPKRPANGMPLEGSDMKRYGQEANPIFAYRMVGSPGRPGAVYIYTPGESVGPREFDRFLGPPHIHEEVPHLSVVTQGEGIFYLVRDVEGQRTLVTIPMKRGDAILIPAFAEHTFWAGSTGNFDVASFTAVMVPTNAPEFQKMVDSKAWENMPTMSYDDYLASVAAKRSRAAADQP